MSPYPWARAGLGLSLLFGFLFCFTTPPFQVPDEPAHFFRGYQISEGTLLATRRADFVGGVLPSSLAALAPPLLRDLPFHSNRKVPVGAIGQGLDVPLEPGRRVFLSFANTAVYGFVPYLPQSVVFAVGRLVVPYPLRLLYIGRLATLMTSALLVFFALRQAIGFHPILFLAALTPMSVFQMASLSADGVTNGLAFLLIGAVLRCAFGLEETIRRRDALLVVAAAFLLALSKPGYSVLAGLALLVSPRKFSSSTRWLTFQALVISASVGVSLVWSGLVADLHAPLTSDLNIRPEEHAEVLLGRPFYFLGQITMYYLRLFPYFANQFVGKLGWVDTQLPAVVVVFYAGILLATAVALDTRETKLRWWQRVVIAGSCGGVVLVISALLYLYATPVPSGEYFLHGVQGRHFIPIGPLLLLLFTNRFGRADGNRWGPWLAATCTVVLATAVATVALRFYR